MDEDAALEEAAKALEQWVTSPAADSDVSVPETPKYTPRRYVSPRPQPIAEVPAAAIPPASYAPAAVATPPLRAPPAVVETPETPLYASPRVVRVAPPENPFFASPEPFSPASLAAAHTPERPLYASPRVATRPREDSAGERLLYASPRVATRPREDSAGERPRYASPRAPARPREDSAVAAPSLESPLVNLASPAGRWDEPHAASPAARSDEPLPRMNLLRPKARDDSKASRPARWDEPDVKAPRPPSPEEKPHLIFPAQFTPQSSVEPERAPRRAAPPRQLPRAPPVPEEDWAPLRTVVTGAPAPAPPHSPAAVAPLPVARRPSAASAVRDLLAGAAKPSAPPLPEPAFAAPPASAAARVRAELSAPAASAAARVRAMVLEPAAGDGDEETKEEMSAASQVRKMLVPTDVTPHDGPTLAPLELEIKNDDEEEPPAMRVLDAGAVRARRRDRKRRRRRWCRLRKWCRMCCAAVRPKDGERGLFLAWCGDAFASDEVSARHWLAWTTRVHIFFASALWLSATIAYYAFSASGLFSFSSALQRVLAARFCSCVIVVAAAKSCKGRALTATKLLKKLPRVLVAKTLDMCVSLVVWSVLLPTILGAALSFHDRSQTLSAFLWAIAAASGALDALGSAAALLAVAAMCRTLPELAALEADAERWNDDDDEHDSDDDMIVDVSGSFATPGGRGAGDRPGVGFSPLV